MARSTDGEQRGTGAVRHLIHRPRSWLHPVPPGPGVEEEFVLAGALPTAHPLFGDGPGRHHDLQATAEMVREAGEFIGHTHFGVPSARVGIFYRFDLRAGDLTHWRVGRTPAQLDLELRVRPDKVVDDVPRVLDFRIAPRIDDVPCGNGSASLVFLAPVVHRSHRERSRAAVLAAAGREGPGRLPDAPVDPGDVGRGSLDNVLLHRPEVPGRGRLSAEVRLPPVWSSGDAEGEPAPARVLLEALRQTALLAAGHAYALKPAHSTLASLRVHFRGYAEPDLPMRCTAVWDRLGKDEEGRRTVPVGLSLIQADRAVLEATTSVVEDL
ncbi:AfsA-related hotdog domain-containing protein [Streptomyces sp. NPDC015350]|uniref:AfsA-related hotdog domain-containing protein n=1 Tax=Streptomyces sp. NPDC015350 TaxID=3364955 RepID=UPI0036FAAD8F